MFFPKPAKITGTRHLHPPDTPYRRPQTNLTDRWNWRLLFRPSKPSAKEQIDKHTLSCKLKDHNKGSYVG